MSSSTTWKIESGHSQIQFKVKHLGITSVNGIFKIFEGTVACPGEGFHHAAVNVSIASNSIETQLTDRDNHLRSAHMFDTDNYPLITYQGILENSGEAYILKGKLTIRNVTKPVKLQVELIGIGKGFAGDERAGFEANSIISRKDFDLTWNIAGIDGGIVIGDQIKLHFDLQLVKV